MREPTHVEHISVHSYGQSLLLANIRLAWKKLAKDKRSSLFWRSVDDDDEKSFTPFRRQAAGLEEFGVLDGEAKNTNSDTSKSGKMRSALFLVSNL